MKKILLLTTTFFLSYCSHAQRKGLWIAPQLSLGFGTMSGISSIDMDAKFAFNFNAGADAWYMFTNNIGAGMGLSYGAYATKWNADGTGMDFIAAQATMDIPVFFRYVSGVRNGFFVQAGFINSFLLGAEEKYEIDGEEVLKKTGKGAKNDFNTFSIYPYAFLGANIACGNRVQLSVGPYFQFQANNNFSDDSHLNGHYFIFGAKVSAGIFTLRQK